MAQPYIGEIRIFAGNFAPAGWAFCDGSTLPISENEALFTLIGTTYGGDGQTTFALPDLRGRIPLHQGTGPGLPPFVIGQDGGVETVTLTAQQMPTHNHALLGSSNTATQTVPTANVLAQPSSGQMYLADTPNVALNASMIGLTGGNQPHDNMGPYLCVSFIISLFGIFPQQS
ncbi:MAG TPA: tail fiber protein [Meiothermus sp.]|jgi:microcystin-dependent protein|nr:tail fiber protein [Meiothermus sp.]